MISLMVAEGLAKVGGSSLAEKWFPTSVVGLLLDLSPISLTFLRHSLCNAIPSAKVTDLSVHDFSRAAFCQQSDTSKRNVNVVDDWPV